MTTAVILAGGLGTRLRNIVPDMPKPMARIHGRPFLEYQMDYWVGQGIKRFILSVGFQRQKIMDHFGSGYRGCGIDYAVEVEPLGTGGGLLLAARGLNEPFLVLNGDTYFEVNLSEFLRFHIARASEWTFALFRSNQDGRYMGMNVASDGAILSLQSGSSQPGQLANGGVYLVNPSVITRVPFVPGSKLSLENDFLPALAATGGLMYGLECTGRFIDIGVPEDYSRAAEILSP